MSILHLLSYPWYLFDGRGVNLSEGGGSIFDLPRGADSDSQIAYYSTLQAGWHLCPMGYAVYARKIDGYAEKYGIDGTLVLPGLKIKGGTRINEKVSGPYLLSDKSLVVRYIDNFLANFSDLGASFDERTRQNVHEIRGLNAGIYHAAFELEERLDGLNKAIAGNITALTQVLAGRIDFIDFLNDPDTLESDLGEIFVFKKFDRMQRCFKPTAIKKFVSISLTGKSHGSIFGPRRLLDLASYLMLDNAVKYAPANSAVSVNVTEGEGFIEASVESIGPKIADDEVGSIFERGVRGRFATASGTPGSGVGLYALKKLVEDAYAGTVSVRVIEAAAPHGGVPHARVAFVARFPRAVV